MKRLGLPIAISITAHGLLLVGLAFWATRGADLPLAGSGGGSGVTVEIVGGLGPRGEGGQEKKETQSPPKPPELKTQPNQPNAPKVAVKQTPSPKSKKGNRKGDDIPVGVPGPSGPGQGPGAPGPGSGEAGGTNTVLAEIRARIERAKR